MIGRFSRSFVTILMGLCVLGAAIAFSQGVPLKPAKSCDDSNVSYGSVCSASTAAFGRYTKVGFSQKLAVVKGRKVIRVAFTLKNQNRFRVRVAASVKVTYSNGKTRTIRPSSFSLRSNRSRGVNVFVGVTSAQGAGVAERAVVTIRLTDPSGNTRTVTKAARLLSRS